MVEGGGGWTVLLAPWRRSIKAKVRGSSLVLVGISRFSASTVSALMNNDAGKATMNAKVP
jgi:hypothetical protein